MTTSTDFMALHEPDPDAPQIVDYFSFQRRVEWFLPDGEQSITFEVMNEGKKRNFQKSTSRPIRVQRQTGDASLQMDPGVDRKALIEESVVGWNLFRNGQPLPFNKRALADFLELADPRIIEKLEAAIRKENPWLLGDISSKDIKDQIEQLQEQLEVALEREAGEESSSSKSTSS